MNKKKSTYDELEKKIEELENTLKTNSISELLIDKELFRLTFDNANIGMILVDLKGKIFKVNQEMSKIIGFSKQELEKMDVNDIIHCDSKEINHKFIEDAITGATEHSTFEKLYKHKKGNLLTCLVTSSIVSDKNGEIKFFLSHIQDITTHKKSEIALKESEELFRTLSTSTTTAIFIYLGDKFFYANKATEEITGYSNEELLEMNFWDVVHPDFKEMIKERGLARQRGEPVSNRYEFKLLKKDKKEVWIQFTGGKINWQGKPAAIGSAVDITQQKKDEEAFKLSERTYRGLINSITEAIYIHDEDGTFIDVNKAAEKIDGYEKKYFIGKNPEFLSAPGKNNLRQVFENIKKAYDGESQVFEFIGIRKDGTVFPNTVSLTPGEYFGKKVVIAVSRDISLPKQMEEALRLSESNLHALINNRNESIWSIDKNYYLIICNDFFKNAFYLAYQLDLKVGISMVYILDPDLQKFWKCKYDIVLSGKRISFEFKEKIQGRFFYYNVFLNPIFSEGKITGVSAISIDISDLKQTEEELIKAKEKAEESERLKSAFLANMSHEIRTPMNGILGFTQLLKEPDLREADKNEYISIIEKSGVRLLNLINDLMDISKVEAGQVNINISEVNINEQFDYVYSLFSSMVEEKGLKLILKNYLTPNEIIVYSDPEKLYAILINLVKNAIKFTHDGCIELGCVKKVNYIEFFVKDTGIGIAKDKLKVIFDRFVQADQSLYKPYEGTGLGLSISKAYVEMLEGKIWVESQKGKGSQFFFTIPYTTDPLNFSEKKEPILELEEKSKIKAPKILIAEDDEISEILLTKKTKLYSKEVLFVRTGIEAVEACRKNPDIDLVLMDIKMPEMDGYAAAKLIKDFRPSLLIIAQTAYALDSEKEKFMDVFDDYIIKPISDEDLKQKLSKFFGISV